MTSHAKYQGVVDGLIVPLWNWNRDLKRPRCSVSSGLIVPLWNWNDGNGISCLHNQWSNRTFMELKLVQVSIQRETQKSSNRTFMELKYIMNKTLKTILQVLIVPLWNWNSRLWSLHKPQAHGSNRTFMELKFRCETRCAEFWLF